MGASSPDRHGPPVRFAAMSEGSPAVEGRKPAGDHDASPHEASGAARIARLVAASEVAGILAPVVLVAAAMAIAFPGFASPFNVDALLATIAVTSVVGLAQVAVLAIGQFNLALPATGAFTGMILGWLLQIGGLAWPPAVLIALAVAVLLGTLQGLAIVILRLNAFIVTLGLASAYYGLMYVSLGNERYQHIGAALPRLGRGGIGPVPNIFFLAMAAAAAVWVAMALTVPGRRLLATGANPVAARFAALPVGRIVVGAHAASGGLAGLAAVLVVGRLAVGSPAIGEDWLLTSFAAPVLGGTILSGGKVSVPGTVLGAALLAMIANALVIVGVSQYWYQAGLGLIILGAVSLDQLRLRLATAGRL
jgi:ribose transport system permease protein